MEFDKLIELRRSVRAYASPVPHGEMTEILLKAQQAPSWKNLQPARCYVVEDEETLRKLREEALPVFNRNSSAGATLIVTTYRRDTSGFTQGIPDNEIGNGWGAYDLGLHDAYLILAARDAGFDTLIMGIRDAARIRSLLRIPEEEEILSVIAVGKAAKEPVPRPRKALEETVRFF